MIKNIDITFDKKELFEEFDLLKKDINKIARRMLSKVFQGIIRDSKKSLTLKKKSGNLFRSFKYKTDSRDMSGWVGNTAYYANFHEQGSTILPKKSKYLMFKIDGQFKKVSRVVLPKREILKPDVDDYFLTEKANKIMSKTLQESLDQIFKETK